MKEVGRFITLHNYTWGVEQNSQSFSKTFFRISRIMSDDLFKSFEAFDASVMDAVNATSTYKMKNIGKNQNPLEVSIGKENVEKRTYLKIHIITKVLISLLYKRHTQTLGHSPHHHQQWFNVNNVQ